MRPHTLTIPKPLIPIAGKPIVYWLVYDIVAVCKTEIENIGFVIGRNFGREAEEELLGTLKEKGNKFVSVLDVWLDCDNNQITVDAYRLYFNFMEIEWILCKSFITNNIDLNKTGYLSNSFEIDNAVIGSYVSKDDNSKFIESRIQNSVIQKESLIKNANLANSMQGYFVTFEGKATHSSIGNYNTISKF